ncbi:MAG: hypothetical protein GX495_02890 [Chloroflexi bacterium]|jgi:hypothetical protein|nr:hypothetical protein [Chloroflexota bacterium]
MKQPVKAGLRLALLAFLFAVIFLFVNGGSIRFPQAKESERPLPPPRSSAEAAAPTRQATPVDTPVGQPRPIIGIGIMGDSNSDEYQADDSRGGNFRQYTLNWVEQLARARNLNFGPWGEWGEPRRSGYKYNWARSGASTGSFIKQGQHTGLAEQVANGEVSHVIVYIGGADFHLERGTYAEIYDGTLDDRAVQRKIDRIIENLTLAVDTVLEAGDVQMVLVNFLDRGQSLEAMQRFPNEAGRERVSRAIQETNERVRLMAEERGIVVVDMNVFVEKTLQRMEGDRYLNVGGELINIVEKGNDPRYLQLRDRSGHMGTVISGLLANAILVEPFNQAFGYDIEPLSDLEILQLAGLR